MGRSRPEPLKVLQVIETTGPGGAETVFLELLRGLGRQAIQTSAVLAGPGWVGAQVAASGMPFVILPSTGSFDLRYLLSLRAQAAAFGAHLVHSHMFGVSAYAALAGRLGRFPTVATLHGKPDLGAPGVRTAAKALALRIGASKVVCVSDGLRAVAVKALGLPSTRFTTIHNGVDTIRFAPGHASAQRLALGVGDREFLALAVGNFRASKGYFVLLDAIALMRERGVPVRLVILGEDDNALAAEFRGRRSALGLDREVITLGFRDDVPELLRAADVYVLSSLDEGFSLSTVQAMATGLPLVATRCGGPEEIVRSEEGVLVEIGSAVALADGLTALAGDPARRARLGAAARRAAVDRFSLDGMVVRYANLYREIVGVRA